LGLEGALSGWLSFPVLPVLIRNYFHLDESGSKVPYAREQTDLRTL